MKVKVTTTTTEYETSIDAAWVWVQLEEDLGLTLTEAQDKMANGSTKIITYAIWIASKSDTPYKEWISTLVNFDVLDNDEDPKAEIPSDTAS